MTSGKGAQGRAEQRHLSPAEPGRHLRLVAAGRDGVSPARAKGRHENSTNPAASPVRAARAKGRVQEVQEPDTPGRAIAARVRAKARMKELQERRNGRDLDREVPDLSGLGAANVGMAPGRRWDPDGWGRRS